MAAEVHLRTNEEGKRLSLIAVENTNHPDYFSCILSVMSRGFGCDYPFCFDRLQAERFMGELESMVSGIVTEGVLKQEYEEDHITVRNDRLGHVFVSGEVNEHGTGHRLMFNLETDQTVLGPFVDDLREAIAR